MPFLLRISHHTRQRDHRGRRSLYPASRRNIPAGGKRSRRHQHGLRRGCGRRARHDRLLRPRSELDAGRHLLYCRRRTSMRDRRRSARRSGPRQHRPGAERLFRHGEGGRPWELPQSRPRSRLRAGDGRSHNAGLRTGRQISQPRHRSGRRLHRPDDGTVGARVPRERAS